MNRSFLWSEWSESFLMALSGIRSNKLRSTLTLLGIVIGVSSIIAVTTAMRVLQNNIESELNLLGSNVFVIQKYPAFRVGGPGSLAKYRNRKDLTYDQSLKLKERATLARSVGAMVDRGGKINGNAARTKLGKWS